MKPLSILRYVSDLHLEYRKSVDHEKLIPLWNSDKDPGDKYYLALLGDICNPFHDNLEKFLELVSPKYDQIFYIPGNHEYYNLAKSDFVEKWQFLEKLESVCQKFSNIILLDNKTFELEGIKIIGSTLWSHVSDQNKRYIESAINDYFLIYENEMPIIVEQTNLWNKECVEFIEKEIANADKPCIVLTHHAPLFSNNITEQYTADPKYLDGKNNEAFHNNMSHILQYPVVAWLYGHTHYAGKFEYNGVVIGTNQLGYTHEEYSVKFNPYAYLDLNKIVLDNL